MIASLRGTIRAVGKGFIVVEVGGVGFHVSVPQGLIDERGTPGTKVEIWTHLMVRENEMALFGFLSEDERELFRLIQTVSGIGPRVALSLLSALPANRLRTAIAQEDVAALRVPGVGAKTAQKLVFDLKDKVGPAEPGMAPPLSALQADIDLIGALTGLGYSITEAQEAMRALPREPLPLEEKIRLALAYFAS